MDTLTREDVKALVANNREGHHLSIYMPAAHSGTGEPENPVRLKGLIKDAAEQLLALQAPNRVIKSLTVPIEEMLDDSLFWRQPSGGVAIFSSEGFFRNYWLPLSFATEAIVGERFHIKPLVPLLSGDGCFYVLAISQHQVRLLEGTRESVCEVSLEDVPRDIAEALEYDNPERQERFHATTTVVPGQRLAAEFYGQGGVGEDNPKLNIQRYLKKIAVGVKEKLIRDQAPLILAGVDYVTTIFREVNEYRYLHGKVIDGNPELVSNEQLQKKAWLLLAPDFNRAKQAAAETYSALAMAGSERAASDLKTALPAAYVGRVAALFVPEGATAWGAFESDTMKIELHQERKPGDDDLFDLTVAHTFSNSGEVYAVPTPELPGGKQLAATFRY